MKRLTLTIVIPLTIISFSAITKWWYALPTDAPDTMFTGFPLAFVCEGWHTSLSLQVFMTEFLMDLLIYFLFWFVLFFCIDRFAIRIKTHKIVTDCLWIFAGLFAAFWILVAINKDNLFYAKRPFEMKVMETGYKFFWQNIERPDYHRWHPKSE